MAVKLGYNKAGYTATLVACGWARALIDKVTGAFGQAQLAQNAKKRRKSNSRKSVRWSAVPVVEVEGGAGQQPRRG